MRLQRLVVHALHDFELLTIGAVRLDHLINVDRHGNKPDPMVGQGYLCDLCSILKPQPGWARADAVRSALSNCVIWVKFNGCNQDFRGKAARDERPEPAPCASPSFSITTASPAIHLPKKT